MKKIMGLFVLMLSLVLMPSGVKAASYTDYFTISGYVENELERVIQIIFTDYKDKVITDDNCVGEEPYTVCNPTDQVTGSFLMENADGKYEEYASGKFSIGLGDDTFMLYYLSDKGLKNDVENAKIKVIINVDLEDYKGKLTIDLAKAKFGEKGNITNLDEVVTEERPKDEVAEVPEENAVISKDILSEIKASGNKVTYESKNGDKVNYAWIFDGSKMTSNDLDVNLELVVNAKDEVGIKKLIPKTQEKPIILDFKHSGVLPGGTRVKVNVSDTYKDGDKVTLYYYNETTKKLEEKVTNIEVKNGSVEFSLEHCSTYTLAKENTAPNNANTASMNVYLYSGISLVSLIGIVALVKTYKKNS